MDPEPDRPIKPVTANARVARIVVSVMIVMATAGLVLALTNTEFRRGNDHKPKTAPTTPEKP